MRIAIYSDLHVEFGEPWVPPEHLDYDVLVLAGDIDKHTRGVEQFATSSRPVIYVAGNHEFYGADYFDMLASLRRAESIDRAAPETGGVAFLENDSVVISGVRFLGTTLWTDYAINGLGGRHHLMRLAECAISDHRLIRAGNGKRFRPEDALSVHIDACAWLEKSLSQSFDGPTVVITHHLPHRGSIAPRYQGDELNVAFASDLSSMIRRHQPALWVHGHTHEACDYRSGATRILCNPRGYPRETFTGFNPALVVEVPTSAEPDAPAHFQ